MCPNKPGLSCQLGNNKLQMQKFHRLTLYYKVPLLLQANKHLAEENEELNAQLLAQAVKEGRHMLQEGNSLAEELDHMTKEEVT